MDQDYTARTHMDMGLGLCWAKKAVEYELAWWHGPFYSSR